jgi:hypothetical protein
MRAFMLTMVGAGLAGILATSAGRVSGRAARPGDPAAVERLVGPNPLPARMGLRHEVIEAVSRGQVGLWEAADRLRDLYAGDAGFVRTLRDEWPAATDDERYARMVINGVAALFRGRPRERAVQVARLEAELASRRSADTPSLPG